MGGAIYNSFGIRIWMMMTTSTLLMATFCEGQSVASPVECRNLDSVISNSHEVCNFEGIPPLVPPIGYRRVNQTCCSPVRKIIEGCPCGFHIPIESNDIAQTLIMCKLAIDPQPRLPCLVKDCAPIRDVLAAKIIQNCGPLLTAEGYVVDLDETCCNEVRRDVPIDCLCNGSIQRSIHEQVKTSQLDIDATDIIRIVTNECIPKKYLEECPSTSCTYNNQIIAKSIIEDCAPGTEDNFCCSLLDSDLDFECLCDGSTERYIHGLVDAGKVNLQIKDVKPILDRVSKCFIKKHPELTLNRCSDTFPSIRT